ncbi:hypothetical protein ASG35_26490 [Burkholderia sp. Leaf177]|nr:hypothetical protein ASG35_26490 [Burkholderia sp. Leaf177]
MVWRVGAVVGDGAGLLLLGLRGFCLADLFSTISHCPWRDFISQGLTLALGRLFVVVGVGAGLLLLGPSRVWF